MADAPTLLPAWMAVDALSRWCEAGRCSGCNALAKCPEDYCERFHPCVCECHTQHAAEVVKP